MTSSLVGSEMCIRDRPRGGAGPPLRRRCWKISPGGDSWDGAASVGSLDPVSYTHLTLPTICSV
eukprot:9191736-Prorocentrum_lima.AAC.1